MPTVVTNNFKLEEGRKNICISGGTCEGWMCSLMDKHVNSASFLTLAGYTIMSAADISAHEITNAGVFADGASALTNIGWYDNTGSLNQSMSADALTFATVTLTSWGCAIWRETDGLIMGFIDFGRSEGYETANADFKINWNPLGVLSKT